jgi:hypothetical protein
MQKKISALRFVGVGKRASQRRQRPKARLKIKTKIDAKVIGAAGALMW